MAPWTVLAPSTLAFLVICLCLYLVFLIVSRLILSPLAKFPGPKLAALTLWYYSKHRILRYEFYYDVILGGQYTFHIRKLHDKYGPIIRINPYELHISDPDFYETLYATSASGEKRDKWEWYTKQFGTLDSTLSTVPHDQHRKRRAPLQKFFSTASIRILQPLIEDRVAQLIDRIRGFKDIRGNDGVLKLNLALAAFTNDVVMNYAYGFSEKRLEDKNWKPEFHDLVVEAGISGGLVKQMFFLFLFFRNLPESLAIIISPKFGEFFRYERKTEAYVAEIKKQPDHKYEDNPYPTIFHEILSSHLPESEKMNPRLKDEAQIVIAAGTHTTSWTLSVAAFHLLSNPACLLRLKRELRAAIPDLAHSDSVSIAALEKCPYLVAVVQESLRLSYGVSSRLERVSPFKPLIFREKPSSSSSSKNSTVGSGRTSEGKEWIIPPGTPVGMTSVLIHQDPLIFPDPATFRPERWLENPRLDRYLVAFSKGSRQCAGINLAYAEMYLCLAAIFGRFGGGSGRDGEARLEGDQGVLELYETDISDVEVQADHFVPLPKRGSKGIRVRVRS